MLYGYFIFYSLNQRLLVDTDLLVVDKCIYAPIFPDKFAFNHNIYVMDCVAFIMYLRTTMYPAIVKLDIFTSANFCKTLAFCLVGRKFC